MRVFRHLEDLRRWRRRQEDQIVGLVPTLGALHRGHGTLIERCRTQCQVTVVSIYVNPTQFNRPEDFNKYPRDFDTDAALCERLGVDAIWAPLDREMYPEPLRTYIGVQGLADHLCGPFRPGHFRAVATVVAKLFLQVRPDRAFFGEKDAQQLAIIRRMTADLDFPIQIVPIPTVREADGLALSSRNALLSAEQRKVAPLLHRALTAIRSSIQSGEKDSRRLVEIGEQVLAGSEAIKPEYLQIVDPDALQPQSRVKGPVLIAIAAWLGQTRLIDNMPADPSETA